MALGHKTIEALAKRQAKVFGVLSLLSVPEREALLATSPELADIWEGRHA